MTNDSFRIERDSLGEMRVPADALYAAQTQRAVENFPISGISASRAASSRRSGSIKKAAAEANVELDQLDRTSRRGDRARRRRGDRRELDDEFVLDIFQTGSGTSTNMNANEVIASRASAAPGEDAAAAGASERPRQHGAVARTT